MFFSHIIFLGLALILFRCYPKEIRSMYIPPMRESTMNEVDRSKNDRRSKTKISIGVQIDFLWNYIFFRNFLQHFHWFFRFNRMSNEKTFLHGLIDCFLPPIFSKPLRWWWLSRDEKGLFSVFQSWHSNHRKREMQNIRASSSEGGLELTRKTRNKLRYVDVKHQKFDHERDFKALLCHCRRRRCCCFVGVLYVLCMCSCVPRGTRCEIWWNRVIVENGRLITWCHRR